MWTYGVGCFRRLRSLEQPQTRHGRVVLSLTSGPTSGMQPLCLHESQKQIRSLSSSRSLEQPQTRHGRGYICRRFVGTLWQPGSWRSSWQPQPTVASFTRHPDVALEAIILLEAEKLDESPDQKSAFASKVALCVIKKLLTDA